MTETSALDCPHGARCGGCSLLGVPYPEQLALKGSTTQLAFARYAEHSGLRLAAVAAASPTTRYRARAKLVFGADGSLGLYARDSHEVVNIPECRVLAPELARVAHAARRTLSGVGPALDGLDLRLVDAGVLVTLIAPQATPIPDLKRLATALCAASPEVRSVAASFRAPNSATLLGSGHVLLLGEEVEPHHLAPDGPYHLAAHGAFTQAHLGQANAAHRAIEAALRELNAERVLELYAGSGALSLRLAQHGFSMTAVEAFAPALAQAAHAAREQRLTLTTKEGLAERALREFSAKNAHFDAVIVNPPRRGLAAEVRRNAAALGAQGIVYMSCDPATLARDLGHLRLLGYAATDVAPFDMIPHSAAVECLVTLRRTEIPTPTVLYEDAQCLAVVKSGYEPGAREAGNAGSLLERVRRLPGAEQAVIVQATALDRDTSGVCLFARTPAARAELERACATAAHTFVALARGVTHKKGRIRRPVRDARRSVAASTRYERSAVHGGHSLLSLSPEHGSALHLRQHLASIGHQVLGDARGDAASNTFFEHRHGLDRSFLHRATLTLTLGAETRTLEAPLPGELRAVLASLTEQPAARGE
ncbi:MAG: pseudouridine synthase [Polyangiaceae bacterium]